MSKGNAPSRRLRLHQTGPSDGVPVTGAATVWLLFRPKRKPGRQEREIKLQPLKSSHDRRVINIYCFAGTTKNRQLNGGGKSSLL